jgi:transposase
VSGKRYVRTSIISARDCDHKLVEPLMFDGMTDTALVVYWVKEMLFKSLPPNSILIWDNAAFHKSSELRELIEAAGHTMLFLPAYSPDLNPIEHKWHELKQRLRSFYDSTIDFTNNLINQLRYMSGLVVG